jgi:ribosomal protein S1
MSVRDYGVFIEVSPGIAGLLHVSKIPHERHFSVGQRVWVRILDVNPILKRIDLALSSRD